MMNTLVGEPRACASRYVKIRIQMLAGIMYDSIILQIDGLIRWNIQSLKKKSKDPHDVKQVIMFVRKISGHKISYIPGSSP